MIMASATARGLAEPDGADGPDAVGEHAGLVVLGLETPPSSVVRSSRLKHEATFCSWVG